MLVSITQAPPFLQWHWPMIHLAGRSDRRQAGLWVGALEGLEGPLALEHVDLLSALQKENIYMKTGFEKCNALSLCQNSQK